MYVMHPWVNKFNHKNINNIHSAVGRNDKFTIGLNFIGSIHEAHAIQQVWQAITPRQHKPASEENQCKFAIEISRE